MKRRLRRRRTLRRRRRRRRCGGRPIRRRRRSSHSFSGFTGCEAVGGKKAGPEAGLQPRMAAPPLLVMLWRGGGGGTRRRDGLQNRRLPVPRLQIFAASEIQQAKHHEQAEEEK